VGEPFSPGGFIHTPGSFPYVKMESSSFPRMGEASRFPGNTFHLEGRCADPSLIGRGLDPDENFSREGK